MKTNRIRLRPDLETCNQANQGTHERLSLMEQSRLGSEPNNLIACEAFGCYQNAVAEIKLRVGTLGFIELRFCNKCKDKFLANTIETRELSSLEQPTK
jgi:hypothetical protein